MRTDAGIFILYYRNWPDTREVLPQVLRNSAGCDVVLLDNASGDGVETRIADLNLPVEVLTLETNSGYAGGMNAAVALAHERGYPYALLLTHDCVPQEGCVERLLGAAASLGESVGLLAPILYLRSNPERVFSVGGWLSMTDFSMGHYLAPVAHTDLRSVEWADGACLLINVENFNDVGGFYEPFFLYC